MIDDSQFDQHLRSVARESLARRAADVDIQGEYVALQARLAGQSLATTRAERRGQARWLVAAAATVLVAGGIVAIGWPRGGEEAGLVAPQPETSVSIPSTPSAPPSTNDTEPSTPSASTTSPSVLGATARPDIVVAGGVVMITPTGSIQRACLDIVTLTVPGRDIRDGGGQIKNGVWHPAPDDDLTPITYPACVGITSDSSVSVVIPVDVPAGVYETCLTMPDDPTGCALVTVTDAAAPTRPPPASAQPDLGFFGRRSIDEPPYFMVDQFSADGTEIATLADDELAGLFRRHTFSDGSELTLTGDVPDGRCLNQPLSRIVDGAESPVHPGLTEARSIGVTANGVVVAGRDVCPSGTRWGDLGTLWELVALDTTAADPSVEILQTRQSDEDQILFAHDDYVLAVGEPIIDTISPDGRHVAFREAYNSEQARWHVLDLDAPDTVLAIESACELAGDIVGPPQFVGDGIVVVARLCAPLHAATDPPPLQQGVGSGDVQVEVIDLDAVRESGQIVWNRSVAGLHVNGYSRTVDLSARRADDGTIWALLTAGGDIEQQSRMFAFSVDGVTELTRIGYESLAFDATELVRRWDQPPS